MSVSLIKNISKQGLHLILLKKNYDCFFLYGNNQEDPLFRQASQVFRIAAHPLQLSVTQVWKVMCVPCAAAVCCAVIMHDFPAQGNDTSVSCCSSSSKLSKRSAGDDRDG